MATKAKAAVAAQKSAFKVSMKTTKENPFYGKRSLLDMAQSLNKMTDSVTKGQVFSLLDSSWKDCSDKLTKEMFYILMFSFGDVANREHNVFVQTYGKGKVESGGNSLRKVFIYCLEWLVKNQPDQFYSFLPIIGEYTNLENPFYYQVRTDRKTGKVKEVLSIVPTTPKERAVFLDKVAGYFADVIRDVRTTDVQHQLLSKFIPKPKFSKRTRVVVKKNGESVRVKYGMQKETMLKELFEKEFAEALSNKLNWEIVAYKSNTRFVGLEKYKAKYNRTSEAFLFSSKAILGFDKEQFHKWLDIIPSGARYRVQRRLFDIKDGKMCSTEKWKGKYGDLSEFYSEWLSQKEKASSIARVLETKEKQTGSLTEDEKETLKVAQKAAKVNTGAETLIDNIADVFKYQQSKKEFDVKLDSMLRKIDVKVPVLVIADVSGSMTHNPVTHKGVTIYPRDMARMAATLFMMKNPDSSLQDLMITFDDRANIITKKSKQVVGGGNRFMAASNMVVDELIDTTKPFSYNYDSVGRFINAGGSTQITSVPTALKQWVDAGGSEAEMRKEQINQYPVWLVISDGDINNASNATASVQDFMHKMKQWFGWSGVLVIWDVKNPNVHNEKSKFDNIENVIHYGSFNPNTVTQVFQNIDDLDVIDVYQPLLSLHRSNRYELVKELVK
jgi:hypothetical protein